MLSLASRLRPKRFDQIIGQKLIVKIVQKGLEKGLLSNVCLFAGPAGTGKTTFARIVSNWLVCDNKKTEDNHIHACLECENCLAFAQQSHPDVLEFDAATNTGIDDIKECLEGMYYKFQLANCKIYIIDEVHMLSKSAISALLKTIEEPAENVWFFLATTEQDKIPETIISRCLTFNLEKVSQNDIADYLKKVFQQQTGSNLEDKYAQLIAFAANGCVRASLAYLDQIILLNADDISKNGTALLNESDRLNETALEAILKILSPKKLEEIYESMQDSKSLTEKIDQALEKVNPILLTMQLINLAKEKNDMLTALHLSYALEELAYSHCPEKVLSVFLWKAQYMKTLPSPQLLWQLLKEQGQDNTKQEEQIAENKSADKNSYKSSIEQTDTKTLDLIKRAQELFGK